MLANKSNTRRVLCQNTIGVTCKIDPSVKHWDDTICCTLTNVRTVVHRIEL
ncbi:hypothetical protein [Wolbachia endosymbiont (group A) of Anomoia purmunda]|uniref:hypothetical protein n=1 Tax=Wolbachia endosymbiont (group A) of Anomoia purmunda TaxID=2953978 RepID=UPI0022317DA3|nr:hypothetical protein [Wolbachia endosymbiont (group A) of Anomoia purmunda]